MVLRPSCLAPSSCLRISLGLQWRATECVTTTSNDGSAFITSGLLLHHLQLDTVTFPTMFSTSENFLYWTAPRPCPQWHCHPHYPMQLNENMDRTSGSNFSKKYFIEVQFQCAFSIYFSVSYSTSASLYSWFKCYTLCSIPLFLLVSNFLFCLVMKNNAQINWILNK